MSSVKAATFGVLVAMLFVTVSCGPADPDDAVGTTEQALAPPGSNAAFVASTIPTSMYPGERRLVTVTTQNTGASSPLNDWTTSSPTYGLGALTASFNWFTAFVPATVPVGGFNTFYFVITAPPTSKPFVAQMRAGVLGYFGPTLTVPVTVDVSVLPEWGCTIVSDDIPSTMALDESRWVTVTVRNTGTATWPATGMKLVSRDAPANLWQQTGTDLTTRVAPGGTATFSFAIRSPGSVGSYRLLRDMKNFQGIGDFRTWSLCVEKTIAVGGNVAAPYAAAVIAQSFPSQMQSGATQTAIVRLRNTGTATWVPGTTLLYSGNTPVNLWRTTQSALSSSVVPGAEATFSFLVVAPLAAGTYTQRWQLRNVNSTSPGFFGPAVSAPVAVGAPPTSQTPPCTPGGAYPEGRYHLVRALVQPTNGGSCTVTSFSSTEDIDLSRQFDGRYRAVFLGGFVNPSTGPLRYLGTLTDEGDGTLHFAGTRELFADPTFDHLSFDLKGGLVKKIISWQDDASLESRSANWGIGEGWLLCPGERDGGAPPIGYGPPSATAQNCEPPDAHTLCVLVSSFDGAIACPAAGGADPACGTRRVVSSCITGENGVDRVKDCCAPVASASPYDATVVRTQTPPQMTTEASYEGSVTLRNTGTASWVPGVTVLHAADAPVERWTSPPAIDTTASVPEVAPGGEATYVFGVTAPRVPGNYTQHWRLRNLEGKFSGYFGATALLPVSVTSPLGNAYAAQIVSRGPMPASVVAGSTFQVSITARNTGTESWISGNLYAEGDFVSFPTLTDLDSVPQGKVIAPGETHTFLVNVLARSDLPVDRPLAVRFDIVTSPIISGHMDQLAELVLPISVTH